MKLKHQLAILAGSLLLGACSAEKLIDETTPPPTTGDAGSREVLLTLKNKLSIKPVGTRVDVPIATAEENYISSLDVYVFASKDEAGPYTFQELLYFRDDAAAVEIPGVKTSSFNLTPTADGTNGLLKIAKGLYVKIYCIANRTQLYQTEAGTGAVSQFTGFKSLEQSLPGQPANVVTLGEPTEDAFRTFHTQLINPAVVEPTADDVFLTPLPMTGANTTPLDLTDFGTSARVQMSLRLSRMVARFDIRNDASKSKFTIEKISMGNGQTHMKLFPIRPLTTDPAQLITYPERSISRLTQVTPSVGPPATTDLTTGAFYTWPSPKEDQGFLILKGKYAINQTQTQEVSYKVPFEQIKNGVGSYIEVAHNHRYTIAITNADPYKLNVELTVVEWGDNEIDPYQPENNFDSEALKLTAANSLGAFVEDNGSISLLPQAGSKFEFEMGSNAELEEKLVFAPGSAIWFKKKAPITRATTSMATVFAYEIDDTQLADPTKLLPVTIRLTNKASGKRKEIKVRPTQGPAVTLLAAEGTTFDPETMTATLWNEAGTAINFKVVAESRSDKAEPPTVTTGSSATASDWLTLSPADATTAEADYIFALTDLQTDGAEGFIEFTATASGAKTRIKVIVQDK